MYYLDDPKPTKFIDPSDKRFPTLPRYDETWFEDVYDIISLENARPRDKVMMGMLASLGIEKGKPYNPDAKTRKAMRQAVTDAYYYMLQRFLNPKPAWIWWKDRHWGDELFADQNRMFTFETDDLIDLDDRAVRYYIGTYYPKQLPKLPATQYLFALADKDGKPLEAGRTYSFTMPAKVPVKQFWSLIIYDLETMAFIYSPEERVGLSSAIGLPNMKKNQDGSVTIFFGPKAPKGQESNWIPTAGKRPFPVVRFYGGTEAFWDKS
jgi:hypothetical protein